MFSRLPLILALSGLIAVAATTVRAQDEPSGSDHGGNGHMTHGESQYADEFDADAAIRALTPEQIGQIERGEGAGYAKAAELNGVPGPRHVLDLKDELGLTSEQIREVESIFADMQEIVIEAGEAYLAAQLDLESDIRAGALTAAELPDRVADVATLEAAVASGHLAAHLQTAEVLTEDQIAEYNRLRGYE